MSAAAKHTVLAAVSVLILGALAIVVPAGGASDRDREVPTKPSNLRVTNATPSAVTVAWDPATDDVGVEGYYVFGDKGKATVEEPQYEVNGLRCGESTLLSVIAFDASRNRSDKATLTVAAAACRDTQPPSVPSGFTQLATTRDGVVLGWSPSSDDTGVVEYTVYRDLQRVTTTSEPRVTLTSLACSSTYIYLVDAADGAGNRSLRASVYVRTAPCANPSDTTAPSMPTGLAASGINQTGLSLSWNASSDDVGVVGYELFRNGTKVASPVTTSAAQSGLACGTAYAYAVAARDAAGNVSQRASLTVSTSACSSTPQPPPPGDTAPPSMPTGLAASGINQTGLSLSWNASSDDVGVVGYELFRNGTKVASPVTTSAAQSGLACGTAYAYAVAARDAAGNVSQRASLTVSTSACSSTPQPPPPGDTAPPSMPTGLAASGINQTGLSLSWNASSDDVGVVGYELFRNGTKVASPVTTSAAQSGLACGTAYAYAVAARDAAGNVSQRASLTVSTSACSSTPQPPPPGDTAPPSTPTDLAVSGATGASVSLRWNASSDNVGVTGYRAYINGNFATAAQQPSATVSGLECGSAYTFAVEAIDGAGNRSASASVVGSTAPCPDTDAPPPPQNVVASSRTMTSIALSWSASADEVGVAGYGLYRAGVQVGTSTSTTGIFSGLACNTNYTLAVDAVDAAGNRSSKSTVMVATTACPDTQPPSPPAGLAATNVTQTGLTLTWNPSSDNVGVTAYDVFRNGTKIATVTGTSSIQSGLTCGTSYTFAVVALDAARNASQQAQITRSTSACPVAPPPVSGPITITQGGTYRGHWKTTSSTPAVRISTAEPVIIEDSIIESTATGPTDYLLSQTGSAANVTIRRSVFNGPNAFPNGGWGRAMRFEGWKSVVIHNNTINRTGGIYFINAGPASSLWVHRNKMFNVQSDRSSGVVRQFLQTNNVHGATQVLAEWNQVINEPGKSRSEDIFSAFNTSNAVFRNNYVQGGYPWPLTDWHKGTGMLISDVPAGFNNIAHDNQIVGMTNGAMGISGGHGHRLYNNTMVSDGRTPDGTILPAANQGVICYDYYNDPSKWYDNRAYGNKIGNMQERNGVLYRVDEYCPGAANNIQADNTFYYGNHSTPITKADEDAEWPIWLAKLSANGITVGA